MKIIRFIGNLVDIMGEDARRGGWEKEFGLRFHKNSGHQTENLTFMEVVDEGQFQKAKANWDQSAISEVTIAEADAELVEKSEVKYRIYDQGLYQVNLQKLVSESKVNLDSMLPEWTDQEELEHLYNAGISGIVKDNKKDKVKKFKDLSKE